MVNVPGLTPWTYQQSEQDSGRMPVGIMYLPDDHLRASPAPLDSTLMRAH